VRVLAATNSDIEAMVDAGRFRNDLFYRVNVFPIEIPPLRSRPEDIYFLVEGILSRLNRELSKNIREVHPQEKYVLGIPHIQISEPGVQTLY
jgi:transcriptional regulator with PAS, ATPase and Fis domain